MKTFWGFVLVLSERIVRIADTNVWCKIIIYVKNTEMCICSKYFILLCVV